MNMYFQQFREVISTSLVGRPPFAAITAWTRLGMDSNNLWQLAGVMELQAFLMDTFSCSKVVGRQAAILFFTILQGFSMGLRFGVCRPRQDLYPIRLSGFGIMDRSLVVLECELVTSKQLLSCRKQKTLQDFLIDSSSDICSQKTQRIQLHLLTFLPIMSPDHDALCKFNAGLCAAGLVSFVGLPPNL